MTHIRPITRGRVQSARIAPEVVLTVLIQFIDAVLTYLSAVQSLPQKGSE